MKLYSVIRTTIQRFGTSREKYRFRQRVHGNRKCESLAKLRFERVSEAAEGNTAI